MTRLVGDTHPLARPEFDQGAAPLNLPMDRMLLVLKRSPEQEAALQSLLDQQHDNSSTNYRRWLTPDEFGQQFGPSDQDIRAITSWLASHGFQVTRVERGRVAIEFSGTTNQIRDAFHTEIHRYLTGGAQHWANAADPQIPGALAPVVAGIASLHNFYSRPLHHVAGLFSRDQATSQVRPIPSSAGPQFTFTNTNCQPSCYALTPYDFATIYNVLPLWSAGVNGAGQKIAIVGRSNIDIQDVRDFRALFNLPTNDPTIVLDGQDPTAVLGDETESDLDVEWAGAVAPEASITLIASASTNTSDGIVLSSISAIDNNVAPVLSVSYGACEQNLGTSGNLFFKEAWEQAAAQGITVVVAAGDNGSAGCDALDAPSPNPAKNGLAVSGFASTPFNVAVGGTDFMNFGTNFDVKNPSPYWNAANNAQQASAKGYVPETTWNDSCTDFGLSFLGLESTPEGRCNDPLLAPLVLTVGGSGGKSSCASLSGGSTCAGGYPNPTWQTTDLKDTVRDLPDVSLFASNGFWNSFYIICEADQLPPLSSCSLNAPYADFVGIGGTSASAPAFAGIMALVNQYTKAMTGQGNANYVLYKLPSLPSQQGLNCNSNSPNGPASGCVFNDLTFGTIAMPCAAGTPNCTVSSTVDNYGVLSGYNAAAGYDLATGLGSVNAYNLAQNWGNVTFNSTSTTLSLGGTSSGPVNITHGQSVPVTITVKSNAGTPTGDVSLIANSPNGEGVDGNTLTNGTVTWQTNLLPGGTYSVHAHYAGDGTFGGSDSLPVAVNVGKEASTITLTPLTFSSGGFTTLPSTIPYGSMVYLRANVQSKALPNADTAPTGTVTFTDNYNGSQSMPVVVPNTLYALNVEGATVAGNGLFALSPGSHSVSASYGGDNSYLPSDTSASPPVTFTITQAPTQTSILPSKIFVPTSALTFDITVTVSPTMGVDPLTHQWGGAALPTGTVALFAGSTQIASATLSSLIVHPSVFDQSVAVVTVSTSNLQFGSTNITAVYRGDVNYTGSTSQAATVQVGYATTTVLASSNSPVPVSTNVTFTAQITTSQSGGPPITGNVVFQIDLNAPTTVPLANGMAQLATSFASAVPGSHKILARYSGDQNYLPSGAFLQEQVVVPDFTLSDSLGNTGNVVIAAPGDSSAPITLTVAGINGYNGTIAFSPSSCVITPAGSLSSCSFSSSSITGSGSTQLVISTTAPHSAGAPSGRFDLDGRRLLPITAGLLFLVTLAIFTNQRRFTMAFGCVILLALFGLWACGSGSGGMPSTNTIPGTPTGVPYSVNITAAPSGAAAHSINLTFSVQ